MSSDIRTSKPEGAAADVAPSPGDEVLDHQERQRPEGDSGNEEITDQVGTEELLGCCKGTNNRGG